MSVFVIVWRVCVLLTFATSAFADTWAIKGMILTPDTVVENGVVEIIYKRVGVGSVDPNVIDVGGIVLPGLIDLHNHVTWNVFPRWVPPRKFGNRYDWQDFSEYDRVLRTPEYKGLIDTKHGCDANLFGEVKALIGGATSIVGSFAGSRQEANDCITGLVRNLDFEPDFPAYPAGATVCSGDASGFPVGAKGVVANEIFPLERVHERYIFYNCELQNGRLRSLIIHLAEGAPSDSSSHREFKMLKEQKLLTDGLLIVHGTALSQADFVDMHSANVGLIWSPRSNEELYGGTTNISAALQAGVPIAIAPDWSPTGSAGMVQELNYAISKYNYFTAQQLVIMASKMPAVLSRLNDRIGTLNVGSYADLLVIRARSGSAYDSVVNATAADVRLVIVGGEPMYGDIDLMRKTAPNRDLDELTVCGEIKAVNLSGKGSTGSMWHDVNDRLARALHRYGTTVGALECD